MKYLKPPPPHMVGSMIPSTLLYCWCSAHLVLSPLDNVGAIDGGVKGKYK